MTYQVEEIHCPFCKTSNDNVFAVIDKRPPFSDGLFPRGMDKLTWRRCSGCGLVFLSPRPAQTEALSIYNEDYFEWEREKYRYNEFLTKIKLLEKHVSGGRLLDAGCGAGGFLRSLGDNWTKIGIDPSAAACSIARNTAGVYVLNHSIEEFDAGTNVFDAVCMWDMIEHTHDPSVALEKASNALRTGGVLGISCALMSALLPVIAGKHWRFLNAPDHRFAFSFSCLKHNLARYGFYICETKLINSNSEFLQGFLRSSLHEAHNLFNAAAYSIKSFKHLLNALTGEHHPTVPMFGDVAVVTAIKK